MTRDTLNIGLFGFGCVGKGLYDVLEHTQGLKATIKTIVVKHPGKTRALPPERFSYDPKLILEDDSINVVVELIDDADAAFSIVREALTRGKAVVSANKKMIAEHFNELLELQRIHNVPLLYEGAACASIPVIRNLEEYYDNDLLTSLEGIVNGSTNYILSKMHTLGQDYAGALSEAQALGFAESDPALDVNGDDARYKLSLLAAHAFGIFVRPEDIFRYGISSIGQEDIRYAREKGLKIKLLAHAKKAPEGLQLYVIPHFIPAGHKLHGIDEEYNGVLVEGVFSDKQFFSGKGAGAYPTASAVLSDLSALTYQYRYEYKKMGRERAGDTAQAASAYDADPLIRIYCRYPAAPEHNHSALFASVEESYSSQAFNYLSGTIRLGDLHRSGLCEDREVFLSVLN